MFLMLRLLDISRHAACRRPRALHTLSEKLIDFSPEVQHALQSSSPGPVVALETALVTHGLPRPINVQTALSIESHVRSVGAIPATIGVLDGRIKVGLSQAHLERLSDIESNPGLAKISRRDLAAAVGLRLSGGTTISGTSLIANLVGIRIFATGGLGGVHRGGEISLDVSADLTELGRTPIAVISGGIKSILDIPKTLEYLETQGVAVFTYGTTNDFPGFFSPVSGCKSPWRINSPNSAAKIIHTGQRLGMKSGMLFAAPIPEEHAVAASVIQDAVNRAVAESEANGMSKRGKDVTPWLLARVAELTQGKSIPSNIALLENTALIGGKIALEYAKLAQDEHVATDTTYPAAGVRITGEQVKKTNIIAHEPLNALPPASLFVIGAAAVDITSQHRNSPTEKTLGRLSTTPGNVSLSSGGVARNIAESAHRIFFTSDEPQHHSVLLISPLGNDLFADVIQEDAQKVGMRIDGFLSSNASQRTAVCNMHLDSVGNLITGVADMSIMHSLTAHHDSITKLIEKHQPRIVAFDANLNPDSLTFLMDFCRERHISTFFEPTSVVKSVSVLPALKRAIDDATAHFASVTYASPNLLELSRIFQEVQSTEELTSNPYWWSVMDGLALGEDYRSDLMLLSQQPLSTSRPDETLSFLTNGPAQMAVSLLPFFQHMFIKCGERGVFVAMRVTGEAALSSGWSREHTQLQKHQVIAKGKGSILVLKHYAATPVLPGEILNVTGAGDSFVGTLLAGIHRIGGLDIPQNLDKLMGRALRASALSLRSANAVSPLLTDVIIDHPDRHH